MSLLGRPPGLAAERVLHAEGFAVLGGLDEVGRGALSGPVTVGVAVVTAAQRRVPRGLRDSKLLQPAARQALVPRIEAWVTGCAVGHASPAEIDRWGIIAALRLAGHRALAALPLLPDCLLLDGNHDYLTAPADCPVAALLPPLAGWPPVRTQVRADLSCASVAAASVLAKTTRDALMTGLAPAFPQYGWEENKGYATPAHRAALRRHGPSPHHRVSWRLPAPLEADAFVT